MKNDRCWRAAAASVEGTSHSRHDLPCQDALALQVFADKDGNDVLVFVVSDGAGSAPKSDAGSMLACSAAIEAVEVYLADGRAVSEIDRDTVLSWVELVRQAISSRAENDASPMRDYACTLLLAVVGPDDAAVGQVGDGAVVVSDGDDWSWVHWPQHGEYHNTTHFVTADDVAERLAFALCKGRIDEIAAFTDGLEDLVLHKATKTVHSPFFNRMMPAVRRSDVAGMDEDLGGMLAAYLRSDAVCERTDDDKTLVLASRRSREIYVPTAG